MDESFLSKQLKALKPYSCAKYPGIEVNHNMVVVPTSPRYIIESLKTIQEQGFDTVVLSWNIMETPLPHIQAIHR